MSEASVGRTTKRVLTLLAAAALAAGIASSTRDTGAANAGTQASVSAHSSAAVLAGGRAASRPGSALRLARLFPGRGVGVSSVFHTPTRTDAAAATCGTTPGLVCTQIDVPLDRTGSRPGTISLHVETLPTVGPSKGVMFLIAGGPGQGSAGAFDLGTPDSAAFNRFLFPGYTLVAYDDRGTGSSGVLRCPALQSAVTSDAEEAQVPGCAEALGPDRDYYSTNDHAEDLEAVRQSLGVDRVGLFGVSYGTKLALAYALAHPTHVERLLLDSVLPPELPDPFFANVLHEMPAKLAGFCAGGGCRFATPDFAGDVAAVLNRLATAPVTGPVRRLGGKTSTVRMTAEDLLSVLLDADLNPGLAAALPAAFHEARQGDSRPLLRAFALGSLASVEAPEDLSTGLFAATTCRDGPFPWQSDTAVADRPALAKAALDALPPGSFGPFGVWATRLGNAQFCLKWPSPAGGAPLGAGPLPDVPVLAISGGFDMRTPTDSAVAVAARFPHGRVLVVPGVGHSTVTADPSFCAPLAVRDWMLGKTVADCPRSKPFLEPAPAFAPVLSTKPQPVKTASQTLAAVSATVREAQAMWLMNFGSGEGGGVAGLYGGSLTVTSEGAFRLVRYSIAPGVEVSGRLRVTGFGPPLQFEGVVTVGGTGGAHGVLGVTGSRIGGTLDGQIVGS